VSAREIVHLDPEVLALLSLGERPGSPADIAGAEAHLNACGACRSQVDELAAVVRTARDSGASAPLVPAPEGVWAAVQAELAGDEVPAPAPVPLARPRRRWLPLAAAASVGLLLGAGVVYAASGSSEPEPQIIASTALAPLEDSGASGSVRVVETATGPRVDVDMTGLSQGPGFFEVWLLSSDASRLISLGVLDSSSSGSFAVPPGVSTTDYPVVDVSLEPEDGDPAHSKNSLARGTLPA
jgi:anti-sigma-K factor RskA